MPPIDAPCTQCLRHGDPMHAQIGRVLADRQASVPCLPLGHRMYPKFVVHTLSDKNAVKYPPHGLQASLLYPVAHSSQLSLTEQLDQISLIVSLDSLACTADQLLLVRPNLRIAKGECQMLGKGRQAGSADLL
jgi:hypothetical protein